MNPVSFKIETESIEEYCDRTNYSDPFLIGDTWWAFPPQGVMATPVVLKYSRQLVWDDKYPECTPFELGEVYYEDLIPWRYKRVWQEGTCLPIIYVRTDVYPLFWVYWWFYLRIKETVYLTMRWFIRVLETWELKWLAKKLIERNW